MAAALYMKILDLNIRENVRYARLEATDEEVVQACKTAEIHDRIMQLPRQYESQIGESMQRFSGGEIQRLAIARLFLQDADIILLDEPTSHLDKLTEGKIWTAIEHFTRLKTTLLVSHQLSAVTNVDKILVLQNGVLVEEGSHKDLIGSEGGIYRTMLSGEQRAGL